MHLFIYDTEIETDLYKVEQEKGKGEGSMGDVFKVYYVLVWKCPFVTQYTSLKVKKKIKKKRRKEGRKGKTREWKRKEKSSLI